ncbi:MAG: 16S rRNA (uracil(1498)-N(3))-methyltransferase [Rhodopila sp.]
MIRLYVASPLAEGTRVAATPTQAHYLGTVMRLGSGDSVYLFNGVDGEWEARIDSFARGKATLAAVRHVRTQASEPDLWLLFAPLKRDMTDLLVQKATELGASAMLPITTERTNTGRINRERLTAIATEAAEQSERLTVPVVYPLRRLGDVLRDWSDQRRLFVALERDRLQPPPPVRAPAALLVGPEGGFGPNDRALLSRSNFICPISLGPRILRAETAAIVGLALLQRPVCG